MTSCIYEREEQVFQSLADWKRGREIAKEMNISVKTFETYVTRLKIMFGCRDLLQVRQLSVEFYRAHPEIRRQFPKQVFKGNNPLNKTAARFRAGITH